MQRFLEPMFPAVAYSEVHRFWEDLARPQPWIDGLVCVAISAVIIAACALYSQLPSRDDLMQSWADFWEEYGPDILDYLWATRLFRAMRRKLVRLHNRAIVRENNLSLLQLPDEILLEICEWTAFTKCKACRVYDEECNDQQISSAALANLAATSRRMRELARSTLFASITIKQRSWRRAGRALLAMERSAHAKRATKTFVMHLDLPVQKHPNYVCFMGLFPAWPIYVKRWMPRAIPQQLATQLLALERLAKLHLVFPQPYHQYQEGGFETVFREQNVALPSVRTLIFGLDLEWMISVCPNVENITADPSALREHIEVTGSALAAAAIASSAKHLAHLEIYSTNPGIVLREVESCIPRVRSFGIVLIDYLHAGDHSPGGSRSPYVGRAGGGNPGHRNRQRREAIQGVGRMVFARLERLDEPWVGDYDRGIVVRDEKGGVSNKKWRQGWRHGGTPGY